MPEIPNRDALEKLLTGRISRELRKELTQILDILGDPPDPSKLPADFWATASAELQATIQPTLQEIYILQAKEQLGQTSIGVDWGLVNQQAVDWARQYSFELVGGITDTSRQLLQNSLSSYFSNPVNIGQLEAQLVETFGAFRAEMIAVTEITRAASMGEDAITNSLLRDNPGMEAVSTWQTNEDDKVCIICGTLDGRKNDGVEAGEPYWIHPANQKKYKVPAHPRCRCTKRTDYRLRKQ